MMYKKNEVLKIFRACKTKKEVLDTVCRLRWQMQYNFNFELSPHIRQQAQLRINVIKNRII